MEGACRENQACQFSTRGNFLRRFGTYANFCSATAVAGKFMRTPPPIAHPRACGRPGQTAASTRVPLALERQLSTQCANAPCVFGAFSRVLPSGAHLLLPRMFMLEPFGRTVSSTWCS